MAWPRPLRMWFPVLVLLGLCLTACGSAAVVPPRALELNHAGAESLQSGDLESASARLTLALEYHPGFTEALTNLALVELQRGNFDRAEQLLNRSRRLDPDIAQTHHGLGVLAEHRHRQDLASDHYREALAVDPGFADARANLARLLFEAGRYEHALIEFQLLLAAAPERLDGSIGLGLTLLSLERLEEASDVARNARQRFGEVPDVRLLEARIDVRSGRFDAAIVRLEALTLEAGNHAATALAWIGVCELALGNARSAVERAEAALALEPDHPLANYVAAVALDDLGADNANAWLARALVLNPDHPLLKQRLAAK